MSTKVIKKVQKRHLLLKNLEKKREASVRTFSKLVFQSIPEYAFAKLVSASSLSFFPLGTGRKKAFFSARVLRGRLE